MDIGFIDQDALSSPETFHPNLEIMKLSTYYKKSKNYVSFILDPSKSERYNKIILRKDESNGDYLSDLILDKRCSYGGRAFTNDIYIPLEEEIENCVPDLSIYNSYFNRILTGKKQYETKKKAYLNSSFVRLSTNEKDCDLDITRGLIGGAKRGQDIYIYDKNITNIDEAIDSLSEVIRGKAQKIVFLYPQYFYDFDKVEEWSKIYWVKQNNEIIYDKLILNKEFKEICERSYDFCFKPMIMMCYDKNDTYTENFLKTDFRNSLNRALYLSIMRPNIRLKCKKEPENENFKMLYRNLTYWTSQNFGSYSFKNFLLVRSKKQASFLKTLTEQDSILRELVDIVPRKILSKGGKWLL